MPIGVAIVAALVAAYLAMLAATIFVAAGAQNSTWLSIAGVVVIVASGVLFGLAGYAYALSDAP